MDCTCTAQLSVFEPRSWLNVTPAVSPRVAEVEVTDEDDEGQPEPEKTRRDIRGAVGGAARARGVRRGRRARRVVRCMMGCGWWWWW